MQLVEQNYEIYDKELLAVVEAIIKWRQYLLDALPNVTILDLAQITSTLIPFSNLCLSCNLSQA